MNSAIIVAGGEGKRVGESIPKQFLKINGKEILFYSVKTFLEHSQIDEVVIVCHQNWLDLTSKKYPDCKVVLGGFRRQDSSLNGVLATDKSTTNVLIHDAARPLISSKIISDCLRILKTYEATAPILKSSNSLIKLNDNIASYIDRTKILEVQTPQCFKKSLIMEILSYKLDGTDEIGMLLRKSLQPKIKFINGEKKNLKLTEKFDFELISKILSCK